MAGNQKNLDAVCSALSSFLSDHFVLFVKTQNFHWHLKDPLFASMHEFLGKLYEDILGFIDPLGERIVTLGGQAPCTLKEHLQLSQIKESGPESDLTTIVKTLIADHTKMMEKAKFICEVAQKSDDSVTDDMMIDRIAYHQKTLWMLNALSQKR